MRSALEFEGRTAVEEAVRDRVRLGFLGVGWIGRSRLEAIVRSGMAAVAGIADPARELVERAGEGLAGVEECGSLGELLELELDGVVIATPSALHGEQSVRALEQGLAVFCQKPLGRSAGETRRVIEAARSADRLLGVDLSYRHLEGARAVRALVEGGDLGDIYAVEAAFHNAYGPDKAWFYDRELSGGGCVIDLGIHIVDLALWVLGYPRVAGVTSRLFARGQALGRDPRAVEDYATARLDLETGAVVQLGCSWRLPAGRDAVIEAKFYGTKGGAGIRNVDGSFYQFEWERWRGTSREVMAGAGEDWAGRAAVEWVGQLRKDRGFRVEARDLERVAGVLDAIYGREWEWA